MQEKKSQAKTTVEYKGETYSYYQTNRGMFDFENSKYSANDIKKGARGAMLAQLYYQLRDCAKRAGKEFKDTFDEFIDNSEPEIIQVFERLLDAAIAMNDEEKNE